MLAQCVSCERIGSVTVETVHIARRVEVAGDEEPGIEREESVKQVRQLVDESWRDGSRRPVDADDDNGSRTTTDDLQSE